MYSKITIAGHPIHPMLIPFPIAFYTATLASFITYGIVKDPFWFRLGYVANWAGFIMALVAAIPGSLDLFLGIPSNTEARKHGYYHMALNVTTVVLFGINLILNSGQWALPMPTMHLAIFLPVVGLLLTVAAGYLGWTLVQSDHVGVEFTPVELQCIVSNTERKGYEPPRKRAA